MFFERSMRIYFLNAEKSAFDVFEKILRKFEFLDVFSLFGHQNSSKFKILKIFACGSEKGRNLGGAEKVKLSLNPVVQLKLQIPRYF